MIIEMENDFVKVSLLDIGATIYKLETKDKDGNFGNIVLTHENLDTYYNGNPSYFGATCGRFAGRIVDGKFDLDGKTYEVSKNFLNKHLLHGGADGISFSTWDYEVTKVSNKQICMFTYNSPHLENGFPGNVKLQCEYILEGNNLTINYFGESDEKTYLNITNHSYFNLSNNKQLYNQKLTLNCDKAIMVDDDVLPSDLIDVKGTEFDFTTGNKLNVLEDLSKESLLYPQKGFDNAFVFCDTPKEYQLILEDEESGRSLKISSTYPTVVLYTYNFPNENGLLDRENLQHSGVAIEPQYAPNAMNDVRFSIPVIERNKPYKETISYTFN